MYHCALDHKAQQCDLARLPLSLSSYHSVFHSPYLMVTMVTTQRILKTSIYCIMRKIRIKIEKTLAVLMCFPPTLPMSESQACMMEMRAFTEQVRKMVILQESFKGTISKQHGTANLKWWQDCAILCFLC